MSLDTANTRLDARRRRAARATTGCCWPPAPSRAGSRSRAPSSTASSTCAASRDSDALRERLDRGGARRRRRRRLDRRRGRRLGPPARPRRDRHRAGIGPAGARARRRGRRDLPRHPHRPRRADAAGHGRRGLRGGRRGRACAHRATGARSSATSSSSASASSRAPQLAAEAGLAVDNGILVDEQLRTSAPGVFAAGDVANAQHPFYGERDPRRALGQRAQPGAGRGPQHARPAGALRPPALLLLRPVRRRHGVLGLRPRLGPGRRSAAIPRAREFIAFWLFEDRVVAGMNVNVWDVTDAIQRLIQERVAVDDRAPRRPRRAARRARPCDRRTRRMNRLQASARRRRLDLARHALARAAGQRRVRAR